MASPFLTKLKELFRKEITPEKIYTGLGKSKVVFDKLPATLEEFKALPQLRDMTSPENTAALLIAAFDLWVHDEKAGIAAVNILKGPAPLSNHEIALINDSFGAKPYLPRAYFKGACPANNYTPTAPFTVEFFPDARPQDYGDGYKRIFVATEGADSTRPILLRKKASAPEWFVWEYPAIIMGVKTPASQDPWA